MYKLITFESEPNTHTHTRMRLYGIIWCKWLYANVVKWTNEIRPESRSHSSFSLRYYNHLKRTWCLLEPLWVVVGTRVFLKAPKSTFARIQNRWPFGNFYIISHYFYFFVELFTATREFIVRPASTNAVEMLKCHKKKK